MFYEHLFYEKIDSIENIYFILNLITSKELKKLEIEYIKLSSFTERPKFGYACKVILVMVSFSLVGLKIA